MESELLVQLILGGFGISGIIGAYVTYKKLPSDTDSAAVIQAQGAMSTMQDLNRSLREEITRLQEAERACELRMEALETRMTTKEEELRQLRDIVRGWAMWDKPDTGKESAG